MSLRPPTLGTILIVEDDDTLRAAVAMLLESAGYLVLEAADGFEALDHITIAAPAIVLVILDLQMPRMSGWSFRERQLADERIADIPTVAVTGVTLTVDDRSRLRFRAVLPKPFVFDLGGHSNPAINRQVKSRI